MDDYLFVLFIEFSLLLFSANFVPMVRVNNTHEGELRKETKQGKERVRHGSCLTVLPK